MFLKSAHLDVQDEDDSDGQISDDMAVESPVQESEDGHKRTGAGDRIRDDAGNVTFEGIFFSLKNV